MYDILVWEKSMFHDNIYMHKLTKYHQGSTHNIQGK